MKSKATALLSSVILCACASNSSYKPVSGEITLSFERFSFKPCEKSQVKTNLKTQRFDYWIDQFSLYEASGWDSLKSTMDIRVDCFNTTLPCDYKTAFVKGYAKILTNISKVEYKPIHGKGFGHLGMYPAEIIFRNIEPALDSICDN